ncbi:MAG: hypothetical protein ABIU05_15245 [Nitrospirales bacterium]
MTRNIIALIGFALLAGCSGGGGDSATPSSAPAPLAQPDMLTATPQGILRGKANGQGQHEIFHFPNLLKGNLFVDQGNIVYPRNSQTDIWTVRTDGTGDHALLNTANEEFLQAVSWPWVIYSDDTGMSFYKSLNTDTHAQFPIDIGNDFIQLHANRVIISSYSQIASETFTGTDRVFYVFGPVQSQEITPAVIVADMLVYRQIMDPPPLTSIYSSTLFAVPFLGGTPIPLESGQFRVSFAGSIGARVVYHRCPFVSQLRTGPCDVVSVQNNGIGQVVLASDPANEAVQGVTTNQVIIRRNLSGNDHLIAVPVGGGAEKLLMTMTDNEFVETIVDDTIIVRRPSGTWSLSLSGTLKQLSNVAGLDGFVPVGNAICSSDVVWCMPLDGSAPAVKIANEGKVVGVL